LTKNFRFYNFGVGFVFILKFKDNDFLMRVFKIALFFKALQLAEPLQSKPLTNLIFSGSSKDQLL